MPIIEAQGLTKTYRVFQKQPGLRGSVRGLFRRNYKEVRAVEDVSFTIEPGEMVAFLGPNGAGKTTTLKMLSGLIYPACGTATVLGFTALGAPRRLPPAVLPRHGPEKPALVGPAGRRQLQPAPRNLLAAARTPSSAPSASSPRCSASRS